MRKKEKKNEVKEEKIIDNQTDEIEEETVDNQVDVKEEKKEETLNKKEKKKKEKIYKEKTSLKEKVDNNKVYQDFKMHKFIIKIVAAIILIAFAILLFIYQDAAIFAVLLITGGVSTFGALIRVFIVFRNEKSKGSKVISGIELAIHAFFGIFLIIGAFIYKNAVSTSSFIEASKAYGFDKNQYLKNNNFMAYFVQSYYPYFLAGILYIRGVAYFYHTVISQAKTHTFTFWLHICCITLAVVIAALASNIDTSKIVITLAVIACLCALVIGGEAVVGYINFNNSNKKLNEVKEEKKKSDSQEINPNILPKDDRSQDSIVS